MNPDRWRRIQTLYARAMEQAEEERDAFLVQECGSDGPLLRELRDMLAGGGEDPDFLESPIQASTASASLPGFELLEQIGEGAAGVVYRARQLDLGREVAVKLLKEPMTLSADSVQEFRMEALAVAKLRHPNIVPVYAIHEEGGVHFFAMEYVRGASLQSVLDRMRAERGDREIVQMRDYLGPGQESYIARVIEIVVGVVEGLAESHTHRIVHRDVKPANVLLDERGAARLVDFGIARELDVEELIRTRRFAGTPYYMSPEQARIEGVELDQRTDIYSTAVVLYELLTLERPFVGATHLEVLTAIREREPRRLREINPRVPRDLQLVCLKAMEKRAADRYPTARQFADDLRRVLRHEAILARPITLGERMLRYVGRHRRRLAGALLLVFGAAAGGLWVRGRFLAADRAVVSLGMLDSSGQDAPGRVEVRRIDPVLGTLGDVWMRARLPLREEALASGYYRFSARSDAGELAEWARWVEPGDAIQLSASFRGWGPSTEGMVRIEGGVLALDEPVVALPLPVVNQRIPVEGFWLDSHEVTNAQYREFLLETQHPEPEHWSEILPGEHDDLPVVFVGWRDAQAYAEWCGKRLPTLAEWLWAARGPEGRLYPWPRASRGELRGNTNGSAQAVGEDEGLSLYFSNVVPVQSHPEAATASGVHHLFGNVQEWVESLAPEPIAGRFEVRPHLRYTLGFFWAATGRTLQNAYGFYGTERSYANYMTGFRCAKSFDEGE